MIAIGVGLYLLVSRWSVSNWFLIPTITLIINQTIAIYIGFLLLGLFRLIS